MFWGCLQDVIGCLDTDEVTVPCCEVVHWVTEEKLPYWHLEHEVLLAEAEADISDSAVEEAGGPEHQDQMEVPREGRLEEGREVPCHVGLRKEHLKPQTR